MPSGKYLIEEDDDLQEKIEQLKNAPPILKFRTITTVNSLFHQNLKNAEEGILRILRRDIFFMIRAAMMSY